VIGWGVGQYAWHMASRPKSDHSAAADRSAAAPHGQRQSGVLVKGTGRTKKGQDLAILADYVRRHQPDLSPLRDLLAGSLRHQTAIRQALQDADVFVRLGTFRSEHSRAMAAIRRALEDLHNQYAGRHDRVAYRPQRPERVPGPAALRNRKVGKPLIEQIKAPMTPEQAQAINERLSAEDAPRRKLPPRP
jgi:hypothetical protein